jgi:hypothetical protein
MACGLPSIGEEGGLFPTVSVEEVDEVSFLSGSDLQSMGEGGLSPTVSVDEVELVSFLSGCTVLMMRFGRRPTGTVEGGATTRLFSS